MKDKPKVCIVDDDCQVKVGWEASLGRDAVVCYYQDFGSLMKAVDRDRQLPSSFECLITGRYFKHSGLDVCNSPVICMLRDKGLRAIFLNWQGYLTKEEIGSRFDGRLFNRYGVRWQTLRSRVQKVLSRSSAQEAMESAAEVRQLSAPEGGAAVFRAPMLQVSDQPAYSRSGEAGLVFMSKPQRCQELLHSMAMKAAGRHKERLEYYASQNHKEGIALLEAIYNRLMTCVHEGDNCPSRYINSSPIVAKSILKEALFG